MLRASQTVLLASFEAPAKLQRAVVGALLELASHGEGAGAGALLAADAVPPLVGLMTAAADDRGVKGANARRNAAIALARLVQADRSGEGLEQRLAAGDDRDRRQRSDPVETE